VQQILDSTHIETLLEYFRQKVNLSLYLRKFHAINIRGSEILLQTFLASTVDGRESPALCDGHIQSV
jgi:hypothetical protein